MNPAIAISSKVSNKLALFITVMLNSHCDLQIIKPKNAVALNKSLLNVISQKKTRCPIERGQIPKQDKAFFQQRNCILIISSDWKSCSNMKS